MAEPETWNFESMDHARLLQSQLHDAWWKLYRETNGGNKGDVAAFENARDQLKILETQAISKYGKDKGHPGCSLCLRYSVFGGPGHEPSSMCRSGKKPHCTCDTCF